MTFSMATTNAVRLSRRGRTTDFSDVAADVADARLYEGLHFCFADVGARKQGRLVAQRAFAHFLRPLDDDQGEDDDGP